MIEISTRQYINTAVGTAPQLLTATLDGDVVVVVVPSVGTFFAPAAQVVGLISGERNSLNFHVLPGRGRSA